MNNEDIEEAAASAMRAAHTLGNPRYKLDSEPDLNTLHPVSMLTQPWTIWDNNQLNIGMPDVDATSMTLTPAWRDDGTPAILAVCSTPHGTRIIEGSWPDADENVEITLFNALALLTPDAVYLHDKTQDCQ